MGRRTAGSVRFDPYWKVQTFDPTTLSWRDVQRAHPSRESAEAARPAGAVSRLMRVEPGGRFVEG